MLKEFRKFLQRGSVIDLAVAVIVGNAFGAIIKSMVDDLFMPVIGVISGGIDFSGLTIKAGAATITYGNFIQAIVNFIIVAFALFMIVRSAARLQREPEPQEVPEPAEDIKLLAEIRDLLKAGR